MRVVPRSGRAIAALLLPFFVATCTEEPVGPGGRVGFAQLAVQAEAPGVGQFAGLTINFVQALVTKPNAQLDKVDTLANKTVPFPPDANSLQLGVTLLLTQPVDTVDLTLNYLSNGTVLFTGSARIEVRQGPASANPVPTVPMAYIGPGANVTTLNVQPRDTILAEAASFPFSVTALDVQGAPVPQFYVSWSSTSAVNVINAAGVLKAGTSRATFFVRAMTPDSIWDSTQVTVVPAPASLVLTSGDPQTAPVSTAPSLPLIVQVKGVDNLGIPGVRVAFAPGAGGGTVDSATVISGPTGQAGTTVILGPTAGQQTFIATVTGLPLVTFHITATLVVGPASQLFLATAPSATAASGVPLAQQPVIQLRDASNQNVGQAGVAVTATLGGTGVLGGTTVVMTNAGGQAVFTNLAITGTVGPRTLTFTSGSLTQATSGTITLGAGPAATIALQAGNGQSAVAGTAVPVPPAVLVTDGAGNPVSGLAVTWTAAAGNGTVVPGTPVNTNGSGISAVTSWTLDPAPKTNTLTATSGTLAGSPVIFTATGTPLTGPLTWTGAAADGNWNNAVNWSGGVIPGATDDALIPAGTPADPALSGSISLHNLTVSSGATLTSADYTINLSGNLDALGTIQGCCQLNLTGPAVTARGNLVDFTLAIAAGSVVTLNGDLTVNPVQTPSPQINIAGELVVNGHALGSPSATLNTSGATGLLTMTSSTDQVIARFATFNGGDETGHLTAGLLDVRQDFVQDTTFSQTSFAATAAHTTRIGFGYGGTIRFASAGASGFHNLIIDPSDGTTQLLNNVFVGGNFTGTDIGTIQVDSFVVSVLGSLDVTGPNFTSTNGALALVGNGTIQGNLSGIFPLVGGNYQLSGNVIGDTLGITNGDLKVSGHTLDLLGLDVVNNGTLTMTDPNDTVYAGDFANFAGGSTAGRLTNGVLILLGDFVQGLGGSPVAFAPSGNHLTVFGGSTVQNVNFFNPGATASHFQNVLDSNSAGGVTVDSAFVLGTPDFATTAPRVINGLGSNSRLVLSNLDMNSVTFNNIGIATPADGSVTFTQFDNITFQGAPVDGFTQLQVTAPGGALAPVILTFNNLTFTPLTTGNTGLYIDGTSSNGLGLNLVVNGSNVVNGPAFSSGGTGVTVIWQ